MNSEPIISSSSDARTAWEAARAEAARPIDTSDPRRQELHEYLSIRPDRDRWLKRFYEADAEGLGLLFEMFLGPDVVPFVGGAPAWADREASDVATSIDVDNNPVQGWASVQLGGGNIDARITRDDTYLIDEGKIQQGPMLLSVYIDDSDRIALTSPTDARAVAHALLAAADAFDRVQGNQAAPEVVHRGPGWDDVELPITKADGSLAVFREEAYAGGEWHASLVVNDRLPLTAEAARTLAEDVDRAAALIDQLNARARS